MALYSKIIIIAGTVTLAYLMLQILKNISRKSSDKTSDSDNEEIREKSTANNSLEIVDCKPKPNKRKLQESEKVMKFPRPKPNFFLGFQVYDVAIHKKVKKLQQKLIEKNPILYPVLINLSTLHVTLAVTHLASDVDIKTVKGILDGWADKNLKTLYEQPVVLTFTGVQTFNDAIAYVSIEQCSNYDKLTNLSQSFNNLLSSAGFSTDKRSFSPHLTILKLSKDFKLLKLKKKFKEDFAFLKECQDHFGKQEVSHIQLLSMDEPKDDKGYYKCFHEIKISEIPPNLDHSECCFPIPNPKETKKK